MMGLPIKFFISSFQVSGFLALVEFEVKILFLVRAETWGQQ